MKLQEVFLKSIWSNLFVGLLILFSQCTSIDTDSKNFDDFLNQFDTSIAEEEQYYVVLSKYACQSCVHSYMQLFIENNPSLPRSTVTFIISNNKSYPILQHDTFAVIFDNERAIERLRFNITEFAILKTCKKRITQHWNFSASEKDEYVQFLEREFRQVH